MIKISRLLIVMTFLILLLSCHKQVEERPDSARLSLDWVGYYQSVIPNFDNNGTYIDIELKEDLTFIKHTKKFGSDDKLNQIDGKFVWSEDGNSIRLISDYQSQDNELSVQEDRLIWITIEGNTLIEETRQNYIMTKTPGILLEREWIVTKLNNNSINIQKNQNNDHIYIYFDSLENKVYGFGGCNFFRATYHLVDNEIAFTPIISTKMSGPNIHIENRFFDILRKARKFDILGNELFLIDDKDNHILNAEQKNKK